MKNKEKVKALTITEPNRKSIIVKPEGLHPHFHSTVACGKQDSPSIEQDK